MSRTLRTRPIRAALIVGALIGAVALAGCGSGQVTQTSEQVSAIDGGSATAGQIAVRDAVIEFDSGVEGAVVYPAGGNAPLEMTIVNSGDQADRLIAASSPVASSVQVSGNTVVPAGRSLRVEGDAAAALAAEAATPTVTPGPEAQQTTPTPSATPAPTSPAGAGTTGGTSIVLTGLLQDIQAGVSYPVVLTFERAGELRVDVPVGYPEIPRQDQHAQ